MKFCARHELRAYKSGTFDQLEAEQQKRTATRALHVSDSDQK